jgi:virginiamycin A acetyltransferase
MIRDLRRLLYFAYFSVAKKIKYRGCTVRSNFVLPGVRMGPGVIVESDVKIYRGVTIGDYTYINEGTRVDPHTASIGKFCSISHNVKIGIGPHPASFFTTSASLYTPQRGLIRQQLYDEYADRHPTTIGNDVFIAANAIVLAGVSIGDGAIVAAGSVVTGDVPAYAIVAGVPAKLLRFRFGEQTISNLLRVRWWDTRVDLIAKWAHLGFSVDQFLAAIEAERKNAH